MAIRFVTDYYPEGTIVAVWIDGDFNSQPAIGTVKSNRAHLWNGVKKPYWIYIQKGDAPNRAFQGYLYANHRELRVIKEAKPAVRRKPQRHKRPQRTGHGLMGA